MKTWKPFSILAAFLLAGSGCDFAEPIRANNGGGTGVEGLTGALVVPGGAPVAGAWVRVFTVNGGTGLAKAADDLALDSMVTNSAGRFQFRDLPDGTYNLAASAHLGDTSLALYQAGIVVEGGTDLGIDTLRVTGGLAVQVRASGAAVSNAVCSVAGGAWTDATDGTGTCVISGLPPGTYQVTVADATHQITITGNLIVYSDFLTAGGIVDVGGGTVPLPSPSLLVAHWDFEEGSGTTLGDQTAGNHDGAIQNGSWVNGIKGKGLSFNGTSTQVLIPHKADLNLRQFTISAWFKSSRVNGQALVSRQTSSGQSLPWNYRLALTEAANYPTLIVPAGHGLVDFSPSPEAGAIGSTLAADGQWHNLTGVVSGTTAKLYLDGVLNGSSDLGALPDTTSTEPLRLGASAFSDHAYFLGTMDEVRIYKAALTASQVEALYRAFAPTALPRIAVVAAADVTISSAIPSLPDGNGYGNKNRGTENGIGPGTYDVYSTSRGLIRFRIPAGYTAANITSAVIRLTNPEWRAGSVSGPFRVDMHRMLKSWKEGTGSMTANSATIDGATALERFWGNQDGSEDWSERFAGLNGIDAVAAPSATVTKSPGNMTSWDFDVTTLARAWAADSSTNFGVILASDFPASNSLVRAYPIFNTREALVADSLKPLLILNGGL